MKLNELTKEMLEIAKKTGSSEELIALAKENNIEATEEEIKAYYEQMHVSGELSDDELDNVAGGGCYTHPEGYMTTTTYNSCEQWKCPWCKKYKDYGNCKNHQKEWKRWCCNCTYSLDSNGIWYCSYYMKS